jgi:hypothetical protein
MKALFNLIACCTALLVTVMGCKNDDNPPTGSNTNNNGTSDSLSITSVTPEHPYPDDIITIKGTGFSDNDTANHVGMKRYGNYTKDMEVLSATTTELRVRIPLADSSNYVALEDFIRVKVGSAISYYSKTILFHPPLRILDVSTPSGWLYKAILPDKQVWFQVLGFNPAEGPATFTVAGATNGNLTVDSVDYNLATQQSTVWCTVPPDLMRQAPVPWPQSLCDSEYVDRPLIVQANGRSNTRMTQILLLPRTHIDSISPNAVSIAALNSVSQSGGQMFVTIHGRSLYGVVNSPGVIPDQIIGTYTETFGVQVGGLGWKVPDKGTYTLYLGQKDCGGGLGGPPVGTFTIY